MARQQKSPRLAEVRIGREGQKPHRLRFHSGIMVESEAREWCEAYNQTFAKLGMYARYAMLSRAKGGAQ